MKIPTVSIALRLGFGLCIFIGEVSQASAQANLFGVQIRASTPNFQLFVNINDDSTVANPDSPLFVLTGGIYGAAVREGVFYAVELENGSSLDYLVTIPTEGNALGARVSANSIGFSAVEGLANVNGQLMAVSLDFPAHTSKLISINHETSVGTLIGEGSFNVILRGLAYDPVSRILYGVGIPWGDGATAINNPNLYIVNPANGATTLVGDLGTVLESLTWSSTLGLVGGFDHLYQINTSTGQATQIGATDYTDGLGTGSAIFNGIYGLASSSVPDEIELTAFSITSVSLNSEGQLKLSWDSETGLSFKVECNPSLDGLTWVDVSDTLSGQTLTMSYTVTEPEVTDSRFYRVVKSLP